MQIDKIKSVSKQKTKKMVTSWLNDFCSLAGVVIIDFWFPWTEMYNNLCEDCGNEYCPGFKGTVWCPDYQFRGGCNG